MNSGSTKTCEQCGKPLTARNKLYCSYACRGLASRTRLRITCPVCGQEFTHKDRGPERCCSRPCWSAFIRFDTGTKRVWHHPDAGPMLMIKRPQHPRANRRGWVVALHITAELLFGGSLPPGSLVRPIDGNWTNADSTNVSVDLGGATIKYCVRCGKPLTRNRCDKSMRSFCSDCKPFKQDRNWNGSTKLSLEDQIEIKRQWRLGRRTVHIAKQFGVAFCTIIVSCRGIGRPANFAVQNVTPPMRILDIRLYAACGITTISLSKVYRLCTTTINLIKSGTTHKHLPILEKGNRHDFIVEAAAYRARILNQIEREKCLPNGQSHQRTLEQR